MVTGQATDHLFHLPEPRVCPIKWEARPANIHLSRFSQEESSSSMLLKAAGIPCDSTVIP